jgi:tetratricopeptide (TPR) repeat protein
MKNDMPFLFTVKPIAEGRAVTMQEAEVLTLKKLEECGGKDITRLWSLHKIYKAMERYTEACKCLDRILALTKDLEEHARCFLAMGCVMERMQDYESAIAYYQQALKMEPCDKDTTYFGNNNLGFSLNQLGRYADAIPYLRTAINIEACASYAHKNLALSYMGLGNFALAARGFIVATHANATDARSVAHLEELLQAHPELLVDDPDLEEELTDCRNAVATARAQQPDFMADWKKHRQDTEPFGFTPQNLKTQLPEARVTVLDDDNMIAEMRLADHLPPFRIRVTRSDTYAPGPVQSAEEFDRECGQPDGWFAGLSKEKQAQYLARFKQRGYTSFTSATEDAIIWLAGLQPAKKEPPSTPASPPPAIAGTDTFRHEYFHVVMEMLRRAKALPDDYVQQMTRICPPRKQRTEVFNEETAAEAYAGHVIELPEITPNTKTRT